MLLMRLAIVLLLACGVSLIPLPTEFSAEAAAKKKTLGKRSDYSPEQRKKITERAREVCRKQFGAGARLHRIDWSTGRIWCYHG